MKSFQKVKQLTAKELAKLTPEQLLKRVKDKAAQKTLTKLSLKGPIYLDF